MKELLFFCQAFNFHSRPTAIFKFDEDLPSNAESIQVLSRTQFHEKFDRVRGNVTLLNDTFKNLVDAYNQDQFQTSRLMNLLYERVVLGINYPQFKTDKIDGLMRNGLDIGYPPNFFKLIPQLENEIKNIKAEIQFEKMINDFSGGKSLKEKIPPIPGTQDTTIKSKTPKPLPIITQNEFDTLQAGLKKPGGAVLALSWLENQMKFIKAVTSYIENSKRLGLVAPDHRLITRLRYYHRQNPNSDFFKAPTTALQLLRDHMEGQKPIVETKKAEAEKRDQQEADVILNKALKDV